MKNYENYVTVQTFTVLIVSHADKPKKITVGKNDGSVPLSGMIRHHIETLQLVSTFKIKRSINKHYSVYVKELLSEFALLFLPEKPQDNFIHKCNAFCLMCLFC